MIKSTFGLSLVFIFCASCKEQNQTGNRIESSYAENDEITTSYGPDSMVRNVRQARNGDVLIASFNAVYRYDGKSFTNLTSSIPSPSFWDVLEDRKGNLWFGTRNSGVYYYNGKVFQHFTTDEGLASNFVGFIHEDRAGTIWFATGGGLSRYDGKSFRNFTTEEGLSNNDVTTIMEDKTGKLWIGTRGAACFYDGEDFTVFTNTDGQPFYNVWAIIEDRKGVIWFSGSIIKDQKRVSANGVVLTTEAGIWRNAGSTFARVSEQGASAMIEDKNGNIWTTGSRGGTVWALSRYDASTLYNEKPSITEIMSIKEGMLCRILEANDGSIWFGSMNGVYRYDGNTITDFKSK